MGRILAELRPVADSVIRKPLSFHAVSFGPDRASSSLRRMAQIALDIQRNAPRDPLTPAAAMVESSFSVALDTVRISVLLCSDISMTVCIVLLGEAG